MLKQRPADVCTMLIILNVHESGLFKMFIRHKYLLIIIYKTFAPASNSYSVKRLQEKCLNMKGNVQDEDPRTTMLAISQLDSIHLHPSEAFTQSDLQCIHLLGIEPMTLELLTP